MTKNAEIYNALNKLFFKDTVNYNTLTAIFGQVRRDTDAFYTCKIEGTRDVVKVYNNLERHGGSPDKWSVVYVRNYVFGAYDSDDSLIAFNAEEEDVLELLIRLLDPSVNVRELEVLDPLTACGRCLNVGNHFREPRCDD